jgi:hypothetical protein
MLKAYYVNNPKKKDLQIKTFGIPLSQRKINAITFEWYKGKTIVVHFCTFFRGEKIKYGLKSFFTEFISTVEITPNLLSNQTIKSKSKKMNYRFSSVPFIYFTYHRL